MKSFIFVIASLIAVNAQAELRYCSKNAYGKQVVCTSDYNSCMSQAGRMGGGKCEKTVVDPVPKNPSPMTGKPGTCLWMQGDDKQWQNLGCVDVPEKCQESLKAYGKKLKLECR